MSVASVLIWLVNPFAGLVAVPAAQLWLLAMLPGGHPRRRVRLLLLGLGVLPPLLVATYHLFALSMDPLAGAWYLLLLVTGHSVGLMTAFIACLMLGALGAATELVYRSPLWRVEDPQPDGPAVYGPGAHAGPGSLGGTASALRR